MLETLQKTLESYDHCLLLNTRMMNKLRILTIALEEISGRLSNADLADIEQALEIAQKALTNKMVQEWLN